MTYQVLYRDRASSAPLGHLLRAADKPGVWARVRSAEARLRTTPVDEGESRGGNFRILFARPFCYLFRVDEPARTVVIERVSWVGG